MLLNEVERLGVLQGQPLLSSVGAPSNRGSGYLVTGSIKPDSAQRAVLGKIREPVDRKEARSGERQMRTRPLRKRPPLRMLLSRSSPNSSSINTTSFSHIRHSSVHLFEGVVENIGRAVSVTVSLVIMAFPPIHNTREMANYVRKTFIWHWRSASRLPHPLPEDSHILCPCFSLAEAESAVAEFELPEIVQARFYVMLLTKQSSWVWLTSIRPRV
ncbi:hypothetical protein Cgig2_002291 [Carnegiea gigantea]|uniref:Uncharacterized protein n=1 Tax=Carnegiea gigantea TaxID=171969 RepID=A0A9Q1KTP4_9CARY|nr:hypothetical protein Cgig2_002291 [Carnegiea gigantea]